MSDASKTTTNSECSDSWKSIKTIKAVAEILSEIIQENKNDESSLKTIIAQRKLAFNSKKPPTISIVNYIERIIKYAHIEESTLVTSLIFIDRVCEINDLLLTEFNVHR